MAVKKEKRFSGEVKDGGDEKMPWNFIFLWVQGGILRNMQCGTDKR